MRPASSSSMMLLRLTRGPTPARAGLLHRLASSVASHVSNNNTPVAPGPGPERKAISPLEAYNLRVSQNKLIDDPYQRKILASLGRFYDALVVYEPPDVSGDEAPPAGQPSGLLGGLFSGMFRAKPTAVLPASVQGIYLWGDVGCGKTMLMDLFYETVPAHLPKQRFHFHQFMQNLHKRSYQLKHQHGAELDVIPQLAGEIARSLAVLCFDEFQVTDVADAMLLRRLLTLLLSPSYGVVLFATLNRAPDDLYLNGIQRALFVPCIQLIKNQTKVIYLNSPTDYRKVPRPLSLVYYAPKPGVKYHSKVNVAACKRHVQEWFDYFCHSGESSGAEQVEVLEADTITVWGRTLHVPRSARPYVAQFTFEELCGKNLSAADYLTLANTYHSFVITDIPYLSIDVRDKVRRFITFLDAVYDARGRIATTAAAPFKDLFVEPENLKKDNYLLYRREQTQGKAETFEDDDLVLHHGFDKLVAKKAAMFVNDEEKFAFARALSRLTQMGTADWVERDIY